MSRISNMLSRAAAALVVAIVVACVGVGQAAEALPPYKGPVFQIPLVDDLPLIDGQIEDREWQSALSLGIAMTEDGLVAPLPTRVWWTWDADHLYFAMRSAVGGNGQPATSVTDKSIDANLAHDDTCEIRLAIDGGRTLQVVFNSAGARLDTVRDATGNVDQAWVSAWRPYSRVTADGMWEMELEIPRTSTGQIAPYSDGQVLRLAVLRHHAGSDQVTSLEPHPPAANLQDAARYTLSRAAAALQVIDIADRQAGTLGLRFGVYGRTAGVLDWTLAGEVGGGTIGGRFAYRQYHAVYSTEYFGPNLKLLQPGDGLWWRIRVVDLDRRVLLDWQAKRQFAPGAIQAPPAAPAASGTPADPAAPAAQP